MPEVIIEINRNMHMHMLVSDIMSVDFICKDAAAAQVLTSHPLPVLSNSCYASLHCIPCNLSISLDG